VGERQLVCSASSTAAVALGDPSCAGRRMPCGSHAKPPLVGENVAVCCDFFAGEDVGDKRTIDGDIARLFESEGDAEGDAVGDAAGLEEITADDGAEALGEVGLGAATCTTCWTGDVAPSGITGLSFCFGVTGNLCPKLGMTEFATIGDSLPKSTLRLRAAGDCGEHGATGTAERSGVGDLALCLFAVVVAAQAKLGCSLPLMTSSSTLAIACFKSPALPQGELYSPSEGPSQESDAGQIFCSLGIGM